MKKKAVTPRRLPENLDFDRLASYLLHEMGRAAAGWQKGQPHDEVAFLSRVTEALNRNRRSCDVGLRSRMQASTTLYHLHRQGQNQTDQYGADLALTLSVSGQWTKTSIFQFKKCSDYNVRLDADDLAGINQDTRIAERSFVLAIDEERLGIRIQKTSLLEKKLSERPQASMGFDATQWHCLTNFLWRWLRCELAPETKQDDPSPVEGLLAAFRVATRDDPYPWLGYEEEPAELEVIPARAWLRTSIEPAEPPIR